VEKDEIVLEISTDKVDSEIPTPAPGKIIDILAGEGETIEVGLPIAIIETEEGKEIVKKEDKKLPKDLTDTINIPADIPTVSAAFKIEDSRFYSPVVMKIASEHQVSAETLKTISGTGINGRLTKKDLLFYLESGKSITGEGTAPTSAISPENRRKSATEQSEIIPLDHIRRKISEHMIASMQTSAHVSLYTEVDMHHIEIIRERHKISFKAKEGFNLTYMPFIVESTVRALKDFPMLNSELKDNKIILKKYYHIGIAVAADNGLIVPNIFHCEEKNLTGLARAVHDVSTRARAKKLKPDELSGGTFSISNFGIYGTTAGFPIINQPQVAILGTGAVKKRPVVISDAIAIRPVMHLSLTIDHRLIDGAMGSQFLQKIAEYLENYNSDLKL
jgi:2-oxoglutarate dehydrogenase E2 component (dihydrolipoamide succinyltransferase)